jgi:formate dehydrogenase major subunit
MWSELRNLRDGIDLGTPPREGPPVAVTIDGKALEVPAGSSVMAAAAMASCPVPKLCATDTLEAFGSCRVCLVEIQGRKGFPAACTTLVEAGMVVRTESPRLQELRRSVMELYLSDFPAAEIPGGWSELHDTMRRLGVDSHPYGDGENHLQAPVDASNPYFVFDPQKCIVCSRCVRACEEIQGTFALTIEGRGFQSKVTASQGESFLASECVSCGACVLACPTHSLVEKSLFPGGHYHAPSPQA